MKARKMSACLESFLVTDGAGVLLRRVRQKNKADFNMDPFLLVDIFDSQNPSDYISGFPMHPHRGIQTLTYLVKGSMHHKDSLGNKGFITDGGFQWMNSGSGILHEEMPVAVDHLLGFQLWLNLPANKKLSEPAYFAMQGEDIPIILEAGYTLRVLSGAYETKKASHSPAFLETEIFDLDIEANQYINFPVKEGFNVLVLALVNDITVSDSEMKEKTIGTFIDGNNLSIETGEKSARVIIFSGKALDEPIAWGGPIVMNTREELRDAQDDLRNETFVKHEIQIDE